VSRPGPAAERGITWYDILGVLPGVSADKIQREYEAKASLLRPELISGAPSTVVKAASRAQSILDTALYVLSNPVNRGRYDEAGSGGAAGAWPARRAFPPSPGGVRRTSVSPGAGGLRSCWAP
jgi:curved DNA-binding protein CbpA